MSGTELKFVFDLVGKLISVSRASGARHSDTAEGIYSAAEGRICLQTDDELIFLVKVTRAVACQRGNGFGIDIKKTAVVAFLLEEEVQLFHQSRCPRRGSREKGCVTRIRGVVILDKLTDVYLILPFFTLEAIPLFKFHS